MHSDRWLGPPAATPLLTPGPHHLPHRTRAPRHAHVSTREHTQTHSRALTCALGPSALELLSRCGIYLEAQGPLRSWGRGRPLSRWTQHPSAPESRSQEPADHPRWLRSRCQPPPQRFGGPRETWHPGPRAPWACRGTWPTPCAALCDPHLARGRWAWQSRCGGGRILNTEGSRRQRQRGLGGISSGRRQSRMPSLEAVAQLPPCTATASAQSCTGTLGGSERLLLLPSAPASPEASLRNPDPGSARPPCTPVRGGGVDCKAWSREPGSPARLPGRPRARGEGS